MWRGSVLLPLSILLKEQYNDVSSSELCHQVLCSKAIISLQKEKKENKLERSSKTERCYGNAGCSSLKIEFGSGYDNGVVVVVTARKVFCSERFYL